MKKFIAATLLCAALLIAQFVVPQAGGVTFQDRFTYACTGATTSLEIYRAPTISGNEWASTFYVYINADSLGGAGAMLLTAMGGMNSAEACTGSLSVTTPGMVGIPVVQPCSTSGLFLISMPTAKINSAPMALPPYVALKLTVHNARTGFLDVQVIAGSP